MTPAHVSKLASVIEPIQRAGNGLRCRGVDAAGIERAIVDLLTAFGEDPRRDGLRDTPARVARFYAEMLDGAHGRTDTVFASVAADQMVVVSGMRVWSLCEHHILPFWCDIAVGYLAGERVIGLSKLGRIARRRAAGLQIQERLVEQIADDVTAVVGSESVAVVATGEHLCFTMRGARMPHRMTSSALRGTFREGAPRSEFLHLAGLR